MPNFKDITLNVTGRIAHEEDFPFRKTKEELALKIRSESLPRIQDLWSLRFGQVSLDADGDIQVETDKGTLFVTRDSVVASAWEKTIASIDDGRDLQVLADVLDELFRARAAFRPLQFAVRTFLSLRFKQALSPLELQQDVCAIRESKLLSGLEPSAVRSVRWIVDAREGAFSDTLEFYVSPMRVDVRQGRESDAGEFPSFKEFLVAARVPALLERLRPLVEPLIADASKLDTGSFRD